MSRFENKPGKALDFIKNITSRITQLDREGGLTRDEMAGLIEAENLVATGLMEWQMEKENNAKLQERIKELEAKEPKAVTKDK